MHELVHFKLLRCQPEGLGIKPTFVSVQPEKMTANLKVLLKAAHEDVESLSHRSCSQEDLS
jgi:hypothetical protein